MYVKDNSDFKGHPPSRNLLTLSSVGYVAVLLAVFLLGALLSPLLATNGTQLTDAVRFQGKADAMNSLAVDNAASSTSQTSASASSSSASVSSFFPASSSSVSGVGPRKANDGKLLSVLSPAESELESAFADFSLAQTKMNNELLRELHELRQRVHVVEKIILLNKDKFVVSKSAMLSAAQAEAAHLIQNSVERTENEVHKESRSSRTSQASPPAASAPASAPTSRLSLEKTCNELRIQYKVAIGQHWGELPPNLQQMWKEIGCDSFLK